MTINTPILMYLQVKSDWKSGNQKAADSASKMARCCGIAGIIVGITTIFIIVVPSIVLIAVPIILCVASLT